MCCSPRKRKLYVDVEGHIYPCSIGVDFYDRLKEHFKIGDYKNGIYEKQLIKMDKYMNHLCEINKQLCLYYDPFTKIMSKKTHTIQPSDKEK